MRLPSLFQRAERDTPSSEAAPPPKVREIPASPPASVAERVVVGSLVGLGAGALFHLSFHDVVGVLRDGAMPTLGLWSVLAVTVALMVIARDIWRRGVSGALDSPLVQIGAPLLMVAHGLATGAYASALIVVGAGSIVLRDRGPWAGTRAWRWVLAAAALAAGGWAATEGGVIPLAFAGVMGTIAARLLWRGRTPRRTATDGPEAERGTRVPDED